MHFFLWIEKNPVKSRIFSKACVNVLNIIIILFFNAAWTYNLCLKTRTKYTFRRLFKILSRELKVFAPKSQIQFKEHCVCVPFRVSNIKRISAELGFRALTNTSYWIHRSSLPRILVSCSQLLDANLCVGNAPPRGSWSVD